jgi:hypothetical protein
MNASMAPEHAIAASTTDPHIEPISTDGSARNDTIEFAVVTTHLALVAASFAHNQTLSAPLILNIYSAELLAVYQAIKSIH